MKHIKHLNEISAENEQKIIQVYSDDDLKVILPLSKRFVAVFSDPNWCTSTQPGIDIFTRRNGLFFRLFFKNGKKLRLTWFPDDSYSWADQQEAHIDADGDPFVRPVTQYTIKHPDAHVNFFDLFDKIPDQAKENIKNVRDEYLKKITSCYKKINTPDSIKLQIRLLKTKLKYNNKALKRTRDLLKFTRHKEELRYSKEAIEDLVEQNKQLTQQIRELIEELG